MHLNSYRCALVADFGENIFACSMTELAHKDQRSVPYIVWALIRQIETEGMLVEVCWHCVFFA